MGSLRIGSTTWAGPLLCIHVPLVDTETSTADRVYGRIYAGRIFSGFAISSRDSFVRATGTAFRTYLQFVESDRVLELEVGFWWNKEGVVLITVGTDDPWWLANKIPRRYSSIIVALLKAELAPKGIFGDDTAALLNAILSILAGFKSYTVGSILSPANKFN